MALSCAALHSTGFISSSNAHFFSLRDKLIAMLPRNAKSILELMIVLVLVTGMYALASASDNINSLQIPSEGAKMGNIYYIDATSGEDSNDGLSPEKAWKSIGKANSAKLNPGDSVLLKRGEVWREQLIPQSGDESGYITYGAYGNGDKPMLLGSVIKNKASDWIHEGGNIWATIPPELDGDELLTNPGFAMNADAWNLYSEGGADAVSIRNVSAYNSPPASYRMECKAKGSGSSNMQFYTTGISTKQGY